MTWQLDCQSEWSKREQRGSHSTFHVQIFVSDTRSHLLHAVYYKWVTKSRSHSRSGELGPTCGREAYQRICDSILRLPQGVQRKGSSHSVLKGSASGQLFLFMQPMWETSHFHMEKQKPITSLPFRWEIDLNALFYSAHILIGWDSDSCPQKLGECFNTLCILSLHTNVVILWRCGHSSAHSNHLIDTRVDWATQVAWIVVSFVILHYFITYLSKL